MRYLGGKHKLREPISKVLLQCLHSGQTFLEPFCGGLNITQMFFGSEVGKRQAGDVLPDLICLYQEYQKGWRPPTQISKQTYIEMKSAPDTNPLKALCRFGCSWYGKDWAGYCDSRVETSVRSLILKMNRCMDVEFKCQDYWDWKPEGALVYCDPPYENTTTPGGNQSFFDHGLFWIIMRKWSQKNLVVVSEFHAPDDFRMVAEFEKSSDMFTGDGKHFTMYERLFIHKDTPRGLLNG